MKTLRIILIAILVLYGLGALTGAILCFFNQAKEAEMQHLGEMTVGLEKMLLLFGSITTWTSVALFFYPCFAGEKYEGRLYVRSYVGLY